MFLGISKFRSNRSLTVAALLGLALLVQAAPPLRVVEAGLHDTEDGPLVAKGTAFVPGQMLFFSCRLDGFQVSPAKKVAIEYVFSALDPNGIALIEPVPGYFDTELSPQDKEWKPKIRQTVVIPPLADSGAYKLRVTATDTLSGEMTSFETPFEVRGRAVQPSDTLVVRNFRFYRREEDGEPLSVAAYRPGDSVWARFDITGYKFGPENQREVAYTVTVTGEGGRVMLKPGAPTVDQGASFYPMRYVPCTMSINLQPTLRPGEFTIVIHAEDRIGKQTHEWKQTFRVE